MAVRIPQGMFVVHLRSDSDLDRRHLVGRIEHVMSGAEEAFASLDEDLLGFMRTHAATDGTRPTEAGQHTKGGNSNERITSLSAAAIATPEHETRGASPPCSPFCWFSRPAPSQPFDHLTFGNTNRDPNSATDSASNGAIRRACACKWHFISQGRNTDMFKSKDVVIHVMWQSLLVLSALAELMLAREIPVPECFRRIRGRAMRRSMLSSVAAAALFCCLPALAAAEVPDQASDCVENHPANSIGGSQPLGQTFQPAQSTLTAVDLLLVGFNGAPPTGDVTVNIREGGTFNGNIIGTSSISGYTIPSGVEQWVRFDFVPPVTVVPDTSYMLEILGDGAFGIPYTRCGYDRGQGYFGGEPSLSNNDVYFRTFGPCGNGAVDAGEDCDDGVLSPDACCAAHTCLYATNGMTCDNDGNTCTLETCSGSSAACTTSAGNAPAGVDCDENDASRCTRGACDGAGECAAVGAPVPTCNAAAKATLSLTQSATPGKDRVKFTWKNGVADPQYLNGLSAAEDDAELCVYGSGNSLVHSSLLPAGTDWDLKFKRVFVNHSYADKHGSVEGVTKVGFKVNRDLEPTSQISWQAGGANLPDLVMSAPLGDPVIAQVVTGAGGCWGAEFSAEDIKKNDGAKFRAAAK